MPSNGSTVVSRTVPKREAAAKASTYFADQMASSSPVRGKPGEASESELSSIESPASKADEKGKGKGTESLKVSSISVSPSRSSALERPIKSPSVVRTYSRKYTYGRPKLSNLKRGPSPGSPSTSRLTLSPMSPLTPISSPTRPTSTPRKRTVPPLPVTTPTKRRKQVVRDDDHMFSLPSPSTSKQKAATNGRGRTSNVKRRAASSSPIRPTNTGNRLSRVKEDIWNLELLENLVWVRVDGQGRIESNGETTDTTYWWPAKIVSETTTEAPLKVTLFNPPSNFSCKSIDIHYPSSSNILSQLTPMGQPRFNSFDFAERRVSDDAQRETPRKRARTNINTSWKLAVQQMNQEDTELNDGLPSTLSALMSQAVANAGLIGAQAKGRGTGQLSADDKWLLDESSDTDELNIEPWTAPPPDPLLDIPGERVLSRDKRTKTEHWPGIILQYILPHKPSEPGKYLVEFLDGKQFVVSRDLFFTSEQDEFATCKMGQYESWKLETEDDIDEGEDRAELGERTLSPEPQMPVPSPAAFCDLSVREQFSYVKPILTLLFNEKYEPARERHDAFIKGGQQRASLRDKAGLTGDLRAKDVEVLTKHLCWWALRGEMFASAVDARVEPQDVDEQDTRCDVNSILEAPETPPDPPVHQERLDQTQADSVFAENETRTPVEEMSLYDTSADLDANALERIEVTSPSSRIEEPPSSLATKSTPPSIERQRSGSPGKVTDTLDVVVEASPSDSKTIQAGESDEADKSSEISSGHLRQIGCPAYEMLSRSERLDYCLNVLLPEAVVQLLLWRSGERQTLDLLSADEEEALHNKGKEKAEEIDWVHSIVQLRRYKEKELRKRSSDQRKPERTTGGTRSRLRGGTN